MAANSRSDSLSDTATYWQGKYGGSDASSSGGFGGGPPSSILDGSAFLPSYTEADKALAWFRLIMAAVFLVLGTYALVAMYRSRYILDIRTRSVHLVLLAGGALLVSYLVALNQSFLILWGPSHSLDWLWSSLVLFFVSPIIFGSYICRALRLAVVFHPRAKRALPWLVPERNHVCLLILMAVGFLAIPIYHEHTLEIWEIIPKQTDILATLSLVFAGTLACIYPFIRKVDDLFNISTELIMVTVLLVILSVGLKSVQQFGGPEVVRWIGGNINFVISAFVFGISVVDPLRRLAFDPLAGSKRNTAERVLLARRPGRSTSQTAASGFSNPEVAAAAPADEEIAADLGTPGRHEAGVGEELDLAAAGPAAISSLYAPASLLPRGADRSASPDPGAPGAGNWVYQGVRFSSHGGRGSVADGGGGGAVAVGAWSFERLARTPLLAAAFETFCRKALCTESILFLAEVDRYERGDYSEPSGLPGPSQYDALCRIADLFIRPGSREEVNISGSDKKRILNWVHKGNAWFITEAEEERRLIFRSAYVEVKNMLEDNLLLRFLQTDQFKSVYAQRQNVTAMMVSPPKH